MGEVFPFDELQHEVGDAIMLLKAVDLGDVRVI